MNFNIKKHKNDLIFLPLGGCNEIGMNFNLYHYQGKWIIIDLGIGFASNIPGVDVMVPNINFAKQQKNNILGMVVTHIHEDHLGAIKYLWDELEVPIYTTKFSADFLRTKLSETTFKNRVPIHEISSKKNLNLGPFDLEFIGLTHSVPDMNAVLIKTDQGKILHSGDWKFDDDPVVGKPSEKEKIAKLGENNEILALVCDSTNVFKEGRSGSEGQLFDNLLEISKKRSEGMILVSTFASNVARVYTVLKLAKTLGRKVIVCGFSLKNIIGVAQKNNFLDNLNDVIISDAQIKKYPRNKLLILATGCQGEPMAATTKIANKKHPHVKLKEGDLALFSSKMIPGNEKKILDLFNMLAAQKIDVITEKNSLIHVSGHPNQDEMKEMYELAKPKIAIPVHGDAGHIHFHAKLAKKWGVPQALEVHNGAAIKISSDGVASIIADVESGYQCVDNGSKMLLDMEGMVIKDRHILLNSGIVIVNYALNVNNGNLGDIQIINYGCYEDGEIDDTLYQELESAAVRALDDLGFYDVGKKSLFGAKKKKGKANEEKINNTLINLTQKIVKNQLRRLINKKPIIEVMVSFS